LFIVLHGWGANYHDLAALAPYLEMPNCQQLFPNAPFQHPYAPEGRMWYGLPTSYTFQMMPDFGNNSELVTSRNLLLEWLRSLPETTGVPLSRIVLAGFSQGGAMTLDVGSCLPLAALVVMSGYLHTPLEPKESLPPLLMVHGRQDMVVPLIAAQQTRDRLLQLNAQLEYHELNMGHEIQPAALALIQRFLSGTIASWDDNATLTDH
jgi:phospholipase/carboxylesterase